MISFYSSLYIFCLHLDPPIEIQALETIVIMEGSDLELTYVVNSNPESTFVWSHNNTVVDSNYDTFSYTNQTIYDVYKKSILHQNASKVTRNSAGIYTVVVDNSVGQKISSSAYVIVNCR